VERSSELLELYQQLLRGDLRNTSFDQLTSNTAAVSVIGTDPTEWSTDRAVIVQMMDAQRPDGDQGGLMVPSDPQAWEEGDLGWVVDRPRLRLPDGTEMQLRVTTIFHRENGTWKGVHQHASIGVPNQ
jgi:hypothetical protein